MILKTIRVTALDLYTSCPYCFYLAYTGVKQPWNPNMELGGLVHKGIEEYHLFGKTVFDEKIAPFLKAYMQLYEAPSQAIEHKFSIPLFDTGIILTGTMDRVNDDWIFEHKTSSANWTQKQADEHKQVTAYSYAYRQVLKKEEGGIRFNILVKNKTPKVQQLDTFRTNEDYKMWKEWVLEIVDNIKNNKFEPSYGRWHNYKICPGAL
jgi:hypothetical protein